jgi:IclR family KDG regulon transcriptional repressor
MTAPLSSIKKALRVLDAFSTETPELGVTEIGTLLKSHKSSISRILLTLMSEGFVEKNPVTRKYRLGLKLVDLGNRVLGRFDLRDLAGPFMEDLARKTHEIIHLSVLDKDEIVYLDKRGEGQTLTVATKIGGRNPAHASAMGKVLLSGLPPEELSSVLAITPLTRFTENTITATPRLLKELKKVKDQGFAVDNEEAFLGIRCVAAPIMDSQRKIIAAISCTVPTQRMTPERMKEMQKYVTDTARQISERLRIKGRGV